MLYLLYNLEIRKEEYTTKRREWLKKLRLGQGFSQSDMAEILNITVQQYSFLERRERFKELPLGIAAQLCAVFNITFSDILQYEEALKKCSTSV